MLLFSTEDLKWKTYPTTEVYLAHSCGGSRAQYWHQLGSAEELHGRQHHGKSVGQRKQSDGLTGSQTGEKGQS
jgi:hypothetical protein